MLLIFGLSACTCSGLPHAWYLQYTIRLHLFLPARSLLHVMLESLGQDGNPSKLTEMVMKVSDRCVHYVRCKALRTVKPLWLSD